MPVSSIPWTMGSRGQHKRSRRIDSSCDPVEQDALYQLAFEEALDDHKISEKLACIIRSTNKDLLDSLSTLHTEMHNLRVSLAERDQTTAELKDDIKQLNEDHDDLEQYGRRNNSRISGIPENENEDTTGAVLELANAILELDPPLVHNDIEVIHRLLKPRRARQEEPRPIIVRFRSKATRYNVISNRKVLKTYNEDKQIKTYINEDLTAARSKLFSAVRKLQKNKYFDQVWTYNGNVKIKDLKSSVIGGKSLDDVKQILPGIDISSLI